METEAKSSRQPEDEVIVRKARSVDLAEIYDILKLEEVSDAKLPPVKQLLEDGFEASQPWFDMVVAEARGEAVGVALYYRNYWSWTGRTVFLRSLCLRSSARRRGIGSRLFREVCWVALEENAQLDWSYASTNSVATAFFAQFKPTINSNLDGTNMMRMNPNSVEEVAKNRRGLNEEIFVRMASREDMAELILTIHEISAFQELTDGPRLDEKDLEEDGFSCTPPWFFALVACRRGSVVGAVIGNRVYSSWSRAFYLQSLYVRTCARRCGIADILMTEFCRIALEAGAESAEFNVAPENTAACALYRRYRAALTHTFQGHINFRLDRHRVKEILNKNKL